MLTSPSSILKLHDLSHELASQAKASRDLGQGHQTKLLLLFLFFFTMKVKMRHPCLGQGQLNVNSKFKGKNLLEKRVQ